MVQVNPPGRRRTGSARGARPVVPGLCRDPLGHRGEAHAEGALDGGRGRGAGRPPGPRRRSGRCRRRLRRPGRRWPGPGPPRTGRRPGVRTSPRGRGFVCPIASASLLPLRRPPLPHVLRMCQYERRGAAQARQRLLDEGRHESRLVGAGPLCLVASGQRLEEFRIRNPPVHVRRPAEDALRARSDEDRDRRELLPARGPVVAALHEMEHWKTLEVLGIDWLLR